jgi:H+/Cl- antiporter ClcA
MSDETSGDDGHDPVNSPGTVGRLIGAAVLLGIVGALSGLVFLGLIGIGPDWYGDTPTGWFEGHPWWIAVAAGAGLLVGILRRLLHMPATTPGLIEDFRTERIELRRVPGIVAVSAVSLVGGASVGPEVALGQLGGGAGALLARRRGLDEDATKDRTLSGMAGSFGGLFSSPLVATSLTLELARPPRRRVGRAFYGAAVASSVSLAIYVALAGTIFLGLYAVPSYDYEDWQLLAGVGFGLVAAVVSIAMMALLAGTKKLVEALRVPPLLLPVLGGAVFGLVGFALPLTNFTGSDQLGTMLGDGGSLGVGLLVAVLVAKMVVFATSFSTGFIGGPIFPVLFLGGTTGLIVHAVIPDVPLGLAFSCALAAVPASLVAAPFTLVLFTVILTQVGALQTAPVLIAVATSYLVTSMLTGAVRARRRRQVEEAPAGGD